MLALRHAIARFVVSTLEEEAAALITCRRFSAATPLKQALLMASLRKCEGR